MTPEFCVAICVIWMSVAVCGSVCPSALLIVAPAAYCATDSVMTKDRG